MRNAFALVVAAVAVIAFTIGVNGNDREHERHLARIAAQEGAQELERSARQAESAQPYEDRAAQDEAARVAYLRGERVRAERESQEWRNWRDMQDVASRRSETYERRFSPRVVIETSPLQEDYERELERIRKERYEYARTSERERRIRYGD